MSELPFAAEPTRQARWRLALTDARWSIPSYLVGCVLLGAVASLAWALPAHRPGYLVAENLRASISERGLAEVFAADALFVIVTGVLGILAGVASWLLFHRRGWVVCLLAIVGAALAALAVWRVGLLVGEQGFSERLATANPGDLVPIDLELHAVAALLVAPFLAITPVMLFAAFWPETAAEAAADAQVEVLAEQH